MATRPKRDRFVTIVTSLTVVVLLGIFGAIGMWWHGGPGNNIRIDYAIIGPLIISNDNYSLAARIAFQTSKENAGWAKKNQPSLRKVAETTLSGIDPKKVNAPGGLAKLQDLLKNSANQQLNTDKVEQVLFIDFLLQTDV